MHEIISIIAGLIMVVTMAPYIIDTVKGKTHPNIVSWFTWTLLTSIGAVAAFSEGAVTTGIFSVGSSLATLTIVILGLRYGVKKYSRFDIVCQALALVGIVLWQITQAGEVAIAIVVAVDMLAALPTIRHAWNDPYAETWQTFVLGTFGSVLALFTITQMTFSAFAYPVWITLGNIIIASVILYRRRQKAAA